MAQAGAEMFGSCGSAPVEGVTMSTESDSDPQPKPRRRSRPRGLRVREKEIQLAEELAASQKTQACSAIPDHVRALLGPPHLTRWESREDYDRLLAALAGEFKPETVTDWILLDEVAYTTLSAARMRRASVTRLALAQKGAIVDLFSAGSRLDRLSDESVQYLRSEVAVEELGGGAEARKILNIVLKTLGLPREAVGDACVLVSLDIYERLEAMADRYATRRDAVLRDLERRKSNRVPAASRQTDIMDAEFR